MKNSYLIFYSVLILLLVYCPTVYGGSQDGLIDVSNVVHLNFRNALADTMAGLTRIEVKENLKKENEFYIVNDKQYSVLVKFYDDKYKLFSEHVATPNHETYLGNALELLETPIKFDYSGFLDGTFLSTLTSTGLTAENLPASGQIEVVLGNKKAMAVSAIACFGAALDFSFSAVQLANGVKIKGLNEYVKYIFIYNALKDPSLINSCTTILSNIDTNNLSEDTIKIALIQIKDKYVDYLVGVKDEILSKYLYAVLDLQKTPMIDAVIGNTLKTVKAINLIEKFGNIAVPVSAIIADIKRGREVTISYQTFSNDYMSTIPNMAVDVSVNSILWNPLQYLNKKQIYSIRELYDSSNKLNPKTTITAGTFIRILSDAYFKVNGFEVNTNLLTQLYTSSGNVHEKIKYKNAIALMYHVFEYNYGDDFSKIYPCGNLKQYKNVKVMYYLKNHRENVRELYDDFYSKVFFKMYPVFNHTLFINTEEVEEGTTKSQALIMLFEYIKYHSLRKANVVN